MISSTFEVLPETIAFTRTIRSFFFASGGRRELMIGGLRMTTILLCEPNLRSRSKLRSVIGGPVEERPCRCSCDLCDCGCNERRLADCGSPRVEQHIHGERGHESAAPTTAEHLRRTFRAAGTSTAVLR